MRRWEAPFVKAFGADWKQCAMADDGARWLGSRWDFIKTFLKNYKIRVTSMPENLRVPDLAKE